MRIIYTALFVALSLCAVAQKAEKVMLKDVISGIDAKSQGDIDSNLDKARISFEKILLKEKDDALSNFGLAVVYSYDKYTKKDYFKAWNHFQIAEKGQASFTTEQLEVLNTYFPKVDLKRRNKPIKKNMDWYRQVVEDKLIKFVREENNIEYAERFLKEFPDSRYYENVKHIRNYIEYRIAENSNSVESYDAFLVKYPDAAQKEVAIRKRDALAFKQAKGKNTLAALKEFADKYPTAAQIEEAKKLMGILAYDEAAQKRTLEAIDNFMITYPNSPKMPDAKVLKREILFERAKSLNTIEAFNEFVALYPEGKMYVDIFNLKANALGQKILMDFPMENYAFIKGFDNQKLDDYGGDIALTSDENILLVVNTVKPGTNHYDNWLLKLAADGKMIWNKFLGNPYNDQANEIVVSTTNEIYVAGKTNAMGDSIPGQAWIYKLDAKGGNIYNRKLEGVEVLALGVYASGDALLGGYVLNKETGATNTILTKVNKSGNKMWSRSYSFGDKIYDIVIKDKIAYVASGNGVFAIDSKGYLVWDNTFETTTTATAVEMLGENLVFAANTPEGSVAMAIDKSGKEKWRTTIPVGISGSISNIKALPNGEVLLTGTYDKKVYIVKVNASGEVTYNKAFETPKGLSLNGVVVNGNQAIISTTLGSGSRDIIVFRMAF